jgi:hypothetical protein
MPDAQGTATNTTRGDSLSSTNHKFPATLPSVLTQNITIGNCQDSSSRSHIKCNHDEKKFSSENEDHQKLRRQGARRQLELDRRRDVQCRTFGLAIRMLERGRLNKVSMKRKEEKRPKGGRRKGIIYLWVCRVTPVKFRQGIIREIRHSPFRLTTS